MSTHRDISLPLITDLRIINDIWILYKNAGLTLCNLNLGLPFDPKPLYSSCVLNIETTKTSFLSKTFFEFIVYTIGYIVIKLKIQPSFSHFETIIGCLSVLGIR